MNPHNNQPTPPEWPMVAKHIRLCVGGACLLLVASCTSGSFKSGPKSEVVVSVKDQKLGLYHDGVLERQYDISTSKFGLGDQLGSYKTPLGKHEVIAKIGHGLPTGAVLKSRSWNGEVLKPNAPGRDPIVSRILWLRGMETNNRNAMKRFIYIHGTTEEDRLGKPASFGCIRMGMKDVVDLFEDVGIGAKVEITKDKLPHGAPKPKPPAATPEPATAAEPAQIVSGVPVPPKTADASTATDKAKTAEAGQPPATAATVTPAIATAGAGSETNPETAVEPAAPESPKAKKSGSLFGMFAKAKPAKPAEPAVAATLPETMPASPKETGLSLATNDAQTVTVAPAPVSPPVQADAAVVTTGPTPAEEAPKQKRGGFFSFFSKKPKPAPDSSAVMPATADVAAVQEKSSEPAAAATETPPPGPPVDVAAAPPIPVSTAPPGATASPAAEPAAPRKRSGFFGLFGRGKKPRSEIAATVEEQVSPERADMGAAPAAGAPTPAPAAVPQPDAADDKAKKPTATKEGSMTTGATRAPDTLWRLPA